MKRLFFLLTIIAILFFFSEDGLHAQAGNSSSVLRHIVIITFKQDAPADSIKALDNIYETLSKNSVVKDFEMGVNISPRDTGVIKHIYTTTFTTKDDMDNYKKSALYKTLFKTSLNVADDVSVADYWTMK